MEHNNNVFYFQDYFPYQGCLPFGHLVAICHLVGMTAELNVYKGSPKSENKLKEMVLTIYNESGFQLFFFS